MALPTPTTGAPPEIADGPEAGHEGGRWSAHRLCVATLVVLPVAVFVVPALTGHPVMPGDDASQNFPMRVLVGHDLRHGVVPLFDPYIWSGAPLLAGWNAGAAYPLTWFFALLPGVAAWTLGLVVTWWVAGLGTYAFLRAARLGPVPAWLGAVSFAFAGAMAAQVVHVGLVEGASWMPLELLAVLRLTEPCSRATRAGWAAVLGAGVALTILAGEPRAVDDVAVVVGIYALWRLARAGGARWRWTAWVLVAVAAGVALGAVQWAPGVDAVSGSQRAVRTAYLFTSGSLPVRWLTFLLVPNLVGGTGSLGQPPFLDSYNLTEVTGYVGVLPLVAAFALLGRLRLRRRAPEWLVWHGVALVGLVLTLGGNTPLWHVLIRLPLFGSQRLQSRNVLVLDLALAVLLAYWADAWIEGRWRGAGARRREGTLLGLLPALGVVGVVVVALTWGAGLLRWLGVRAAAADGDGALKVFMIPFLVVALGVVALLLVAPRLGATARRRVLVSLVVADLTVFSCLCIFTVGAGVGTTTAAGASAGPSRAPAPFSPGALARPPAPARPVAALGLAGRFAIYDPNQIDMSQLLTIGMPDTNAMAGVPSSLGYSSIVNGIYAAVTGSHQATGGGLNVFTPVAAADGTLDSLDTSLLLTPAQYLLTSPGAGGPPPGTRRRTLAPGSVTSWYFGMPLKVSTVTVSTDRGSGPPVSPAALRSLRLGLRTAAGTTVWLDATTAVRAGTVVASVPQGTAAVGVVAATGARAGIRLDAPVIAAAGGQRYVADGQLQGDVTAPHWRFAGMDGLFAAFRNTRTAAGLTLRASPGGSTAQATVRRLTGTAVTPTSAAVSSPHGVEVVRSVAAIAGWTASWRPASGGPARALAVQRRGLVQVVAVPAGTGVVSWRYVPPGLVLGEALGTAGGVVLVALVALALVDRRRGARDASHPSDRLAALGPAGAFPVAPRR